MLLASSLFLAIPFSSDSYLLEILNYFILKLIFKINPGFIDFPVAQTVKNLPEMQETRVQSLGWEVPLKKEWQSTPVFLPGEFHGQRSLAGYSPWGCKELDLTERLTHTHVQYLGTVAHLYFQRNGPRADRGPQVWCESCQLKGFTVGCSSGSLKCHCLWFFFLAWLFSPEKHRLFSARD